MQGRRAVQAGGVGRVQGRRAAQSGSVGPVLVVLLGFALLLGWLLAGAAARHYVRAAGTARSIAAGELAQAGLEAALGLIDARDPAVLAGQTVERTGQEATGTYRLTVRPSGRGTYLVESVGEAGGTQRGILAEVAPPPEAFAVLAGGSVAVNYQNLIDLGSRMTVRGDINAHGEVSLTAANAALSVGSLVVEGDVRAGGDVGITARALLLLASAEVRVTGGVAAGGDVRLETDAGLLLTNSSITVRGPVTYGGRLVHEKSGLLGFHDVDLDGPVTQGGGAGPPDIDAASADAAFYEALVADLAARGALRTVPPTQGCSVSQPTRVTGDLDCFRLTVEDGAVLVVDGSLRANVADVAGLVYVRGGPAPDPTGHVTVGTLSLLEIVHSLLPTRGWGTLAATGDIRVSGGKLAALLSHSPNREGVLQVLALDTGDGDDRNDLHFGIGGLADALGGSTAAPLLLYAGGNGSITLRHANVADAISFQTLPLIAVAGGDVDIDVGGLADVLGTIALEARPDIWRQVPPFLQGMGRARVLSWEWMA